MTRLARVVIPGLPHHVTQRGNGGARTFSGDDDYALYRDLLAASCRAAEVDIWARRVMRQGDRLGTGCQLNALSP